MELLILFGQRKQKYIGEYVPEALEIVTEYDYDDNPDWINVKAAEADKTGEFEATAIVRVDVDDVELRVRLQPNFPAIQGKIV